MRHREFAYCGLFGATALLLPVLFHLVHLGHIFMPMYLPLVSLAFLVRPGMSALTALIVPLLSGAVTGMPPFYPPVAPVMAAELALMAALIGISRSLFPRVHVLIVLIPVLVVGRAAGAGLMYVAALLMGLPATFVAGISFISGWPGIVLMIVAVPAIVRLSNGRFAATGNGSRCGNGAVSDPRIGFFDSIADKWDTWHDLRDLDTKLDALLREFGIDENASVLDVGCGTGNLTVSLLRRLGPAGRVVAIDISKRMLERARKKVRDNRVSWHRSSADRLPIEANTIDHVICFSVWPHFENPEAVAKELCRVLRPGGRLHILHLISRSQVNHIHEEAHPSVRHDRLVPAGETAELLEKNGFKVVCATDNELRYLVTACKQG